ncbi:MAG: PDDEXK nuclease domain-containing protein [Myxococcaceae bacterium]
MTKLVSVPKNYDKIRDFLLELGAGFAFVGKLNFYLSAVDGILRGPGDEPSIGLILCKSKNKIVAEYSLQDSPKPMGVSTYKLPKKLKEILPTIEEIEMDYLQ